MTFIKNTLASLLLLAAVSGWPAPAAASSLCVNHGGTGGCYGTIAAAMAAAGSGDTIHVIGSASPYFERLTVAKSLSLTGDGPANSIIDGASGGQVLRIMGPVTVTVSNLTIRNGQSGAGNVDSERGGGIHAENASVTLSNVVVSGNHTGGGNPCCGGGGGGIYASGGVLTLINSWVTGNGTGSATFGANGSGGAGGGILARGVAVSLLDSRVSNNTTGPGANSAGTGGPGGTGGGLMLQGGSLTMTRSAVSDNTTGDGGAGAPNGGPSGEGGGIYLGGLSGAIRDSTISGNRTGAGGTGTVTRGASGSGGGLYAVGDGFNTPLTVTLSSSTVSGNATGRAQTSSVDGDGGGLYANFGITFTLTNVTMAFNLRDSNRMGGGIASPAGSVFLQNSLLTHNVTAANVLSESECSGALSSLGYNVLEDPFCAITTTTGDQFFVGGPIVLALANNGGPTLTNALLPGSVAVDHADNSACSSTDQRGLPRPAFGGMALRCDVGAFELYRYVARLPLLFR